MLRLRVYAMFLVALAVCWTPASAQNYGEFTGVVQDATGGVLPGVSVTITNPETGFVRTVVTNDTGNYRVPFLSPGVYDLQAELPGFNTASRSRVTLQVGDVLRIDFVLQVGEMTEIIEVAGQTPLINVESAELGTVIEMKRIVELPLDGRNYTSLITLSPNVSAEGGAGGFTSSRQGGERGNQVISVAGQRIQFTRYTLDGIENTDVNFNSWIIRPSIDALQEFKVLTGVYSAEYGAATSQVSVNTRSGTNSFHGTLFHFHRNSALDAKEWLQEGEKNPFRRNQFGYTFGGPVFRDKLFFLSNMELLRDRNTFQRTANVATLAMRAGDFSAVDRPIFDPDTRVFAVGPTGDEIAVSATQFLNNQIPSERIHPIARQLLEFYPEPTVPGDNTFQNFVRQVPRILDHNQFTQRIDYVASDRSSWNGRFSWGDELLTDVATFPNQVGSVDTRVYQFVLSNIRNFGTSTVMESRAGYNQFQNDRIGHHAFTRNVSEELGIIGLPAPIEAAWGAPQIGLGDGISGFAESNVGPYINRNHSFHFKNTLSVIRGQHSFKFGAEYRRDRYNQTGNDLPRGVFSFSSPQTADPANRQTTGHAFASFLLGHVDVAQSALGMPTAMFRRNVFAAFFEDTWRLTPKLTINAGLRYENWRPFHDKYGAIVNYQVFDSGVVVGPDNRAVLAPETQVPGLVRPGVSDFYHESLIRYPDIVSVEASDRLGRGGVFPDNNDFAPRLGLAYSPNRRWSFRTGIGVFYTQDIGQARFDMVRNLSGRTFFFSSHERPNSPLEDPWRNDVPLAGCSNWDGFCAPSSTQVQGNDPFRRTPYVVQWLFNIQHELTEGSSLEVGYMGNSGSKLERIRSYNEPVPRTGLDDGRSIEDRRPWPVFGRLHFLDGSIKSNYHAGNFKFQRRFSGGLTYLLGFTWSKSIDNGSAIRNQAGDWLLAINGYDFAAERGLSNFHVGKRFVGSILYELPFGVGQRFANSPGVLNAIIGGWQISSIITLADGTPISLSSIGDTNGTQWGNRPHAISGVDPHPDNPTVDKFWNIEAFDASDPNLFFEYGSAGRNTLIGPSFKGWDFSMIKNIAIRENHSLQFRFEAFNFPNHPNWNAPSSNARVASTFGRVTSARSMRSLQFGLKYSF